MKKTIILMWNPYFSSYKMEQFEDELHHLHLGMTTDYNWSIHEHDKVEDGDRFYMVRCGQGRTGIVMSGTLVGDPYGGEDWAGRGRKIYYMDMQPDYYVHTDKVPTYVSTEYLLRELPGFDWTGGKAGRVLPAALADKLEDIWARYTQKLHDEGSIDGERAAYFDWSDITIEEIDEVNSENTLLLEVDKDTFDDISEEIKQDFNISIGLGEENQLSILENKDGILILNVDELPNRHYGCHYHNGGVFPYIIKDSLKYVLFICEEQHVLGKIVKATPEVVHRFRFGDNPGDPSVEDPNGDSCIWEITFDLVPAK